MNKQEIIQAMSETLEKTLPSAVETVVDDKMKSFKEEIAASNEKVTQQMKELAENQKFSAENEAKELHTKTANFFKSLARHDASAFAEAKAAFLNEGTDSEGGHLVPNEFAREVLRVARELGFARKYCRIVPMTTDKKDISKIINGVTVYWTGEGQAYTNSKPELGLVQLIANKMTALVSGTNELIADNQTDTEVFELVRDLIAEGMAEFEDKQVDIGTGTNPQFPGIFTESTGIPTIDFANPAKPTLEELIKLKNKVPRKYRKKNECVWRVGPDLYSHIESLQDENGRPLIKESLRNDSEEVKLLGFNIEVGDSVPVNKIAFGNYKYYLLGDRKSLSFEVGYATGGFESDVQSLKASQRLAGKVAFTDAFAIGKGA